MIPLRKENGIAKKKKIAPKKIHSFIVDLMRACIQWRATICMHAYSVAVSVNVYLRVQIAVLYAIAESKTFSWSF